MISIVILGSGNVATHLTKAYLNAPEVTVAQVYARNLSQLTYLKDKTPITNKLSDLAKADVYVIAVSDTAIAPISKQLETSNSLVVHTSGSVAMETIENTARKGVLYPLQSFSKEKKVDFKTVPFCLEASTKIDLHLLTTLAKILNATTYNINSTQRRQLHVAAVFVNNFVNHLYSIGHELCDQHKVPFEILHPLITETAAKIVSIPPAQAQTGPAIRKDQETIEKHLSLLSKEQKNMYILFTEAIQHHIKPSI